MEKSKLISLIIAQLKFAYPYYFDKLSDEEFIGMFNLYQEHLGHCEYQILLLTIKKLISESRYMPSIADILYEYKDQYKQVYTKLIQNSDIEDKDYLLNMIDWYSYKSDYPNNIPKEITNRYKPLLANNKNQTKLLESGDENG